MVYIVSHINKAIAFEWIASRLPSNKIRLSFILLNPDSSELQDFLNKSEFPVAAISYRGIYSLPVAFFQLTGYLRKNKPNIIHCHLFHASLLGLFAGWILNIKKRIYTRHHSTYNHEFNKKGVWIDKAINWLATDIVAISNNVRTILEEKEKVKPQKIHLIHHGFDLESFRKVDRNQIESLKSKYNPNKKLPVIGVIARWIEWKGIQYIVPAFKTLLNDYPNALLVLANADGPYRHKIELLLKELPESSYVTIPFENDLFALYQLFDLYVHTPINPTIEAFGQTYVESLAAGIPSVFTLSGVAPEFVELENNALVVPFCDANAVNNSMKRLLNDKTLRDTLISDGRESVKKFDLSNMIEKLEVLYLN